MPYEKRRPKTVADAIKRLDEPRGRDLVFISRRDGRVRKYLARNPMWSCFALRAQAFGAKLAREILQQFPKELAGARLVKARRPPATFGAGKVPAKAPAGKAA
jgi:hypothetical protein